MNKTEKSRLQELCQKNCWILPTYTNQCIGGSCHCPIFVSSVCVNDIVYKGGQKPNKKAAENDAALIALETLETLKLEDTKEKSPLQETPLQYNDKRLIFFDIENTIGIFRKFVTECKIPNNTYVIGYMSAHHHMRDKLAELTSGNSQINISFTNALLNNAVDYNITLAIGMAIGATSCDCKGAASCDCKGAAHVRDYILVTGDKFGHIVETIVRNNPELSHINITFISRFEDLKTLLSFKKIQDFSL
jgi:hypothetical protein